MYLCRSWVRKKNIIVNSIEIFRIMTKHFGNELSDVKPNIE